MTTPDLAARLDSSIEERASENDRLWFAAHPRRKYRIRPLLPGELAAKKANHILVIQFRRGVRLRKPVEISGQPPADNDVELERLGKMLLDGQPAIVRNGRVHLLLDFPVFSRDA